MKKVYLRNVAMSVIGLTLLGGFTNAQVFEIPTGDTGPVTYASKVNNDGLVLLKTNKANYTWTEQAGLVMVNQITNDALIPGNPSLSADASVYTLSATNPQTGNAEASLYNPTTQQFTFLGSMGKVVDGNTTGPYGMSLDGKYVVGGGWLSMIDFHAYKWSQATGLVDLGTAVADRNTRANAISADGSTVVGFQESEFGDWNGVYWKNGQQTYITDQNGDKVPEAQEISSNGKWIIGGMYNFNAWKWSAETGLVVIPHPEAQFGYTGFANAINHDGSVIVGNQQAFQNVGLPNEGFIWTEATGRIALNTYVDNLGLDRNGLNLIFPTGISDDGKMISGNGYNANHEYVPFMIKLPTSLSCADQKVTSTTFGGSADFGGTAMAFDIPVGSTGFTAYGVNINAYETDAATTPIFTVKLYDNAGNNVPGTELKSLAASIKSKNLVGNADGTNVYNYVLGFDIPMTLDANKTYWMSVDSNTGGWQVTGPSNIGAGMAISPGPGMWIAIPQELVYGIECSVLATSEVNADRVTFYPNPVKDVINFNTKKEIKQVAVYNAAGQQVMSKSQLKDNKLTVSALTAGVYLVKIDLGNGQVQTLKVIKQ